MGDRAARSLVRLLARLRLWFRLGWRRIRGWANAAGATSATQFAAVAERQASTRADVQRLEKAFRELCANVDTLHARIHELEARERGTETARANGSLNLNTKSQVLKLARNGESARSIAATLGVPLGEVDFALKVHRILTRAARQQKGAVAEGQADAAPAGRKPAPPRAEALYRAEAGALVQ